MNTEKDIADGCLSSSSRTDPCDTIIIVVNLTYSRRVVLSDLYLFFFFFSLRFVPTQSQFLSEFFFTFNVPTVLDEIKTDYFVKANERNIRISRIITIIQKEVFDSFLFFEYPSTV